MCSENDSIVSTNVKEFFEPVCITDGEGIRADMSYQQHGTQLYIGGYGSVFVDNIAKTAGLFTGTRFALNDEQIKLFSEFVRNTYLNVFRSHYMDFSVCGRSVSRAKTLDPGNYAFLFNKMKEIDPTHADYYDMAAQRFSQNNSTMGAHIIIRCFICRTICFITVNALISPYVPYPTELADQKAETVKTC